MFFLLLLPLATALAARLRYQDWRFWAVWSGGVLVSFLVLCLGELSAKSAFLLTSGVSGMGFVAPELWGALRNTLRRPRSWLYLGGGGGIIYLLVHPDLWGALLMLGIVLLGIWVILKPWLGPKRR